MILALTLSLGGAVAIVALRSRAAMTPALRAAAGFLEHNDPRGPYRLDAPGRLAGQLRAYVGGSPPIASYGTTGVRRPRGLDRPGIREPAAWIARLRRAGRIAVPDMVWTDPEWPVYYVRVGGRHRVPENAIRIYDQDGVTIYHSEAQ